MMRDMILSNARLVLADEVIEGTLYVVDGTIAAIDHGKSANPAAMDCEGDLIIPGLIELHTDNLEKHFAPRPGVSWPALPAAVAHDAQLATAGITTVFDAVCLGDIFAHSERVQQLSCMIDAICAGQRLGHFRADHFLHLRCELSYRYVIDLFDEYAGNDLVGLVSLMDHTPGQRQFVDVEKYRQYYKKKWGLRDDALAAFTLEQNEAHDRYSRDHRKILVDKCHDRELPIASHDDASIEHVQEAIVDGAVIAEFPTTLEAARAAHKNDLKVLMGAPNLVLGGSHSGNISAMDLSRHGLLDIVSSDYVPSSLIHGLLRIAGEGGLALDKAIALATVNPARAAGMEDRGEIDAGKRADLVRVATHDDFPRIVSVWRKGQRIV